ncbi:hypothetical protein A4A49_40678 [Nicotiana attenuata]|uniref:PB1-like domain-containing protein n=1 Tax=Nicotiana attenuata TaxID=49451 RepID=A0A314KVN9_NICAT|nr:hypothetical protein A4A49_40678 [Nicotiana attenuata]
MDTKYVNLRWKTGGILLSEVGPLYVGGRVEHVTNVDCDHLSIPALSDYAKDFGIRKLGKTYIMSAKGGSLVELTKDRDLMDLAMLLNNGDTIDIFVSSDSQFEEVDAIERSQISHVGEPFNASSSTQQDNRESFVPCGPSLNTTAANPDLGLPTPLNTTQEEDSPIDWTSSSEEEESAAADDVEDIVADSQQVEPAGEEEEIASGDESERSFDYGSDVHEELRVVKEDMKKYRQKNRRKLRKEKPDGFLGKVGVQMSQSRLTIQDTNAIKPLTTICVIQNMWQSSNPKHGLPTARKVYTGPLIDSTHVTGDIGYKPSKGLKWKGKEAVTQRQLQVQAAMARIKTRS